MAIEIMLRQTTHDCSIQLIFTFSLAFISCLEIRDDPRLRCELVKAAFVSLNGVRVWWNATTEQRSSVEWGSRCQLRIGRKSCDDSLFQYDDSAVAVVSTTTSYMLSHTFWMDFKTVERTKGYTVCIRSVNADGNSQEKWTQETLNVRERLPPVIGSCSVSIGTEARSIRFDKRDIYIYRKGDRVTFSCSVEGKPLPSVRWCKNTIDCSENASSNGTAGGGILESADEQSEGVYVAVVENNFGRVLSEGIHIRQAVLEDFKADDRPTSLSYKAGDTFTISCRSPHSVPEPEISWLRTRPPDTTWHPIQFNRRAVLGLDGSLTILNANATDSGGYRCKAKNQIQDHSLYSKAIAVKVLDETVFDVHPIIHNKNQLNEEAILGLSGNSVRMQCIFSGRPVPKIQWSKDSSLIAVTERHRMNLSGEGFTLTISNLTTDDEGNYKCRANNSQEESQFTIKLIVQEPPSIVPSLESKNATEGETVVFTCLGRGIPPPNIDWKINGNSVTEETKALLNISISHDRSRLTFHSVNLDRSCSLQCNLTNDHGYRVSSASLSVFSPTRIQSLKSVDGKDAVMLTCDAQTDALLPLLFQWTREDKVEMRSDEVFAVFPNGSLLISLTAAAKQKADSGRGNYTCTADSGLSVASETIQVPILTAKKESVFFPSEEIIRLSGVVLFGVLLTILVAILTVIMLRRRRLRKTRRPTSIGSSGVLVGTQISHSSSRADSRPNESHECLVCENDLCSGILLQNDQLKAAVRQMYIPRERIQLRNIVGKGQFGRVYYAYLRDPRDIVEEVAVKTMKYKPDESEMVELFLKEAALMKDFQHIHVLGVLGITFDSDDSPMVILPFMANGDLRRYILQPHLDITILQLLLMGLQVARGMHYLSQMRFVHRDLAARNCMVNDRGVVKVADFGLSRQLVRDYYRVESSGTTPVPVRWMAPECLEAHLFTTMSDVWSFGVLLWELMTRGAVPYPNVENWQIPNHVQSGNRLEQPLFCPDIIYEIMTGCWEVDQQKRPSFLELVDNIQNIVESVKPGARESSILYQNIVRRGKSESEEAPPTPRSPSCQDHH